MEVEVVDDLNGEILQQSKSICTLGAFGRKKLTNGKWNTKCSNNLTSNALV